ncbi:MAG: hypothetical protein L0154_02530 [Chloroflexi bacterium]|nr:hypothetical protein [Chloroflexota bacterium]
MGDMPNFEDMSEEEQMRWLESLAKRQGADEGFTTSADMEVAEIDPETAIIDEPGYTPYYQSSSRSDQPGEIPSTQETPQPQAEAPQEPDELEAETMAVAGARTDDDVSSLIGDDPMAWLESLAKRQGAHEGFTTAADMEIAEVDPETAIVDEPGYTPYYQSSSASTRREEVQAEEVSEASVQDPYPTPVPEIPPAPMEEEPETVPVPEAPVAEAPEVQEVPEAPIEEAPVMAGMPGEGDLPADIDPMVWLESLAKRQGAHEGFTTAADMEVEEIDPESVVLDEPGYTPYYSTATTGGSRPAEQPEEARPVAETPTAFEDEEIADGWLQSLATEQEADVDEFLTELTETTMAEFEDDFSFAIGDDLEEMGVIDLDEEEVDVIAGMSDEEIAAAQIAGTITPEQELAWLQSKIAQAPDEDSFDLALSDEELGEPVEGEIPDWLKQQMPTGDQLEELEEFIIPEPDGDMGIDLDDSLIAELAGEGDLDFDLTPSVEEFSLEESQPIGDVTNLLEGYSPEVDEWAAALDEDVRIEDIESLPEPDWYSAALQQADAEAPSFDTDSVPALSFELDTLSVESFLEEEEDEIPGWLQGVEPTIEEDVDLPDWLKVAPAGDEATDVSDWLSAQQAGMDEEPSPVPTTQPITAEQAAPVAAGLPLEERLPLATASTMPGWYVWEEPVQPEPVVQPPPPPVREVTPEPVAQTPTPPPTRTPVPESAVAPVPVGYEDYKQRLEANPQDHDTRVNLARNLSKSGNLDESLAHYETLINSSAKLDLVATDLGGLIKNLPRHPKARRMLGDVYMRQGRLQEALDTYRGALDQI